MLWACGISVASVQRLRLGIPPRDCPEALRSIPAVQVGPETGWVGNGYSGNKMGTKWYVGSNNLPKIKHSKNSTQHNKNHVGKIKTNIKGLLSQKMENYVKQKFKHENLKERSCKGELIS